MAKRKVLGDVIKLRVLTWRLSFIIQVQSHVSLQEEGRVMVYTLTHRSRDWSDVAAGQGVLACGNWKIQGTDCPLEPHQGAQPVDTLISVQ